MPYRVWSTNDVPSAADFNILFADPAGNDIATTQTTTSSPFVNLTTAGPTISNLAFTAGQTALVIVSAVASISGGPGHSAQMGFQVTGAASQAPQAADCAETQSIEDATITRISVFTASVAGNYTFQAKYGAVNNTTASFGNRRLIVRRF